ncbi:MAG: 2-amino-4-hydroxy-6-hydroxymethyldihydropteridine diphosphokinase [Vulcanimicrobiaceae bacterium]
MIVVALGANLPSGFGPPHMTLDAAVGSLAQEGGDIVARSRIYRSAPVPRSDQPEYFNAVVALKTKLDPSALLAVLNRIEARFGRERREPNAARTLDLDLIAYDDIVRDTTPILPHPRMHERAFVLLPMAEIAPTWRHPRLGLTVGALIEALSAALRAETRPVVPD